MKDIGHVEEEDVVEEDAEEPSEPRSKRKAAPEPITEIVAPEFEGSKLHSGQLEFLTLIRVISDPDLQSRLWPRLTDDHFASETARAVYSRLRTLQVAGREWPKIGTLAIDPALSKAAQTQLTAFIAKAEKGNLAAEITLVNGQKVSVSRPEDFEGHVYDVLDSFRVIRKSWEHVLDATNKIADEQSFDPLTGPEVFERAATEILGLRGKEAVADALMHFGYGISDEDNKKRQREVLKTFATDRQRFKIGFSTYDERAGGIQPGEVVLIGANTGGGKCILEGSLVITDKGVSKIEEIAAADVGYTERVVTVYGINGAEQTSHVYKEVVTETWVLKTDLGFCNTSTAAHRVWALRNGHPQWVHQKDLKPGDTLVLLTAQRMWGNSHNLPLPNRSVGDINVCTPREINEELARFLGYMVSEGHVSDGHIGFTNYDLEVMDDFRHCVSHVLPEEPLTDSKKVSGQCVEVRFSGRRQLLDWLEAIGLHRGTSKDREIPWCVRAASEPVVKSFVQALYEGDGYIQQDEKKQVLFSTTSKLLHDQLKVVLLNFGIVTNSVEQEKVATNGTPGNRSQSWTLVIGHKYVDLFAEHIGFISSRKNNALRDCLKRGQRNSVGRKTEYVPGAEALMAQAWEAINQCKSTSFAKLRPDGLALSNCVRKSVDRGVTTKTSIRSILRLLESAGVKEQGLIDPLRFLAREDVVCDTVRSVERVDGQATVYDFVVPGTHSFCANGLVQHNTALQLSMMTNMARMGTSVAMLQLELTTTQVNERLSSNLADMDSDLVRSGKLTDKQKKQIVVANDDFHDELKTQRSRLTIFAPSSATIQECEYVFKTFPYRVWFIDYINLLKWEGGGKERSGEDWTRLSDIVKEFKRLAKKYGIAVVLAVQVNVDRDSGDIEIRYAKAMKEHADVVLVWNLTQDARQEGVVWMRHLKARQYEPFDFPVRVALNYCRFESVNMALQPKTEERKLGAKKRIKKEDDAQPEGTEAEPETFKKKEKPLVAEPTMIEQDDDVAELIASASKRVPLVLDDDYKDMDDE